MRKGAKIQNRFIAAILALIIVFAMIPINAISVFAATEDFPEKFTITVKDSEGNMIDAANVVYSVKVDEVEQFSDNVKTDNGIAVIENMDTIDMSNPDTVITLSAVVSKVGYDDENVVDEVITEPDGNIDVTLIEKEIVSVSVSVKDSLNGALVTNADVSITGYCSVSGKTINGVFEANLYKGETYSVEVTKKGYKPFSKSSLSFDSNSTYDVSLEAKLIDDTFVFAEASPSDIEYGDNTYENKASSSKSTGAISYGVKSGDSVSVNAESGKITTLKAGTSIIKATLAEDENYQESEITYEITVTSAPDSGFSFADPNPVNRKYVENDTFTNVASGGNGTGKVTYAVTSGDAATVNKNTGELNIVKAGEIEVTATREADDKYAEISVSYSLTIEKADQADFKFEVLSPENQYITNSTYTNKATGGSGKGKITYSVKTGSEYAKIEDPNSPVVTFVKVGGPITIEAVKAGDDCYKETSAEYNFYIIKSSQAKLDFETTLKTIVYSPDLTFSNPISGGSGDGAVTYEIISGNDFAEIDENTGVLKIRTASDENGVVVKATKAGDDNYNEQTAQFTLIINKAEQTGFEFADGNAVNKTWSPDRNTYVNTLSGGQSKGAVTYSVVGTASEMPYGGPCASFDNDTATVTMYGKGSITIKAVKAGDACYQPIENQYTLTIHRASQTGFAFGSSVPTTLTYNDNDNKFDLSYVGGNGAGAVDYSIESGDAVSINGNKATVVKAGDVKIRATKADTNTYESASATIDVTIAKANQYIAFADTTTTSIIYGNEFTNAASEVVNSEVPDGKGYAPLTKITYSVVEGGNIVSVDNSGKLTFKNNATGNVTIKASKEGDDCYNDTSADYSLNVEFLPSPDTSYTLSGAKINDSGWYSGDVTITPAEGYQISYSNALTGNQWSDSLVVSDEGYNEKTVYLKNDEGVSGAITIPSYDIRIDKSIPKNLKISYSTSVIDSVFEVGTFGFYKAPATVTIEAVDDISNVALFNYTYGDISGTIESEDIIYSNDKKTATASFSIPAQFKGSVSFTATDTAGNKAEKHDDKVVIVDDIAPGVTVSFDNNDFTNSKYYSADRTATIQINESNFFPEAFDKVKNIATDPASLVDEHLVIKVRKVLNDGSEITKIYKNEDLTTPFREISEGIWEATLLFDEDADYTFVVEYKDFSGNVADKYETCFTVDKIKPTIGIYYDNNEATNSNYYKADRTATVMIVEHNFRPSDIVVDAVSTTNVQDDAVDVAKDYQELLRKALWSHSGDAYFANIPFNVDAKYKFTITYADLAENEQENAAIVDFILDKTAPDNLTVSYSPSVLDTIIEAVTFGIYQAPATVTITADDMTAGVDYFTYSYGVQDGASSTNVGKGDTVISKENIDYSNKGKTATATFTIPAQFRGSVSFKATDKSGNDSEVFNDNKVIIVDDVVPGLTVSYDTVDASNNTFYKTDRTATITIKESNFFKEAFDKVENTNVDPASMIDEHLVISVTKVNNDNVSVKNVLKNEDLTTPFTKSDEDTWVATLLFDEDVDYTWTIEYKDFSGNVAGTFTDSFTIDKINPVISIAYDNNDKLNTDHYKENRTATVTVVEHNFRPSDIVVKSISAIDIQGNDVDYSKDYQELLREGTWTDNGNTHTLDIPFDVDARYNFEINYSDLAGNTEVATITDEFCVDKLAPSTDSLKVSYSASILDTILETVTFGFYNAPVTVAIEADDITSGVDYFTYSYNVSKDASKINQGESDVVIKSENIEYSDSGRHALAKFDIKPQFRGKVSFTATDRAGNTSEVYEDGKVIIVDNVAPGVTVSYDNNSANYGTYYKNARTATIKINEANFFPESFEKHENIAVNPSDLIDEHLVITVKKEFNDKTTTTTIIKNDDLTTPFMKSESEEDTWQATLLFDEDADYTWSVDYKDFSGASAGKFEDSFTVDNIDPVIEIMHGNNDVQNGKYFKDDRPVTITITEHNFKAEDVVVNVTADREVEEIPDYAAYLSDPANWESSGNIHTANITFATEAYYTFGISYVDMAGRLNKSVNYGESKAPTEFVIDKSAPTETDITIDGKSILAKDSVAFEKFYKSAVEVKYKVNCDISELDNITYQKVDSLAAYSENGPWKPYDGSVKVKPSEKFIIYFRAEDKSGNVEIVHSTGIVVDNKAPEGERYAPEIDIKPESANDNGYYSSNVSVDLKVVDPKYNGEYSDSRGYYSGLKKVSYKIYAKDINAEESGTLFDLDSDITTGAVEDTDGLIKEWNGKIKVLANKFNSNNVFVEIYAIDNAGNERTSTISKPIKIDITAPSINVSYQDGNGNGDATFSNPKNGAFFKKNRTAVITITERNFNWNDVTIVSTKDGNEYEPKLLNKQSKKGSGNGDGTIHTATITYSSDGIYTFGISSIDKSYNVNKKVGYKGLSPRRFTIDKTAPVFSVSYDNNSALNGNYYKAQRTATLTVIEHNFETSRIQIPLTATDNGRTASVPNVSSWTSKGDTHTATISYSVDAHYTFDFEYNDKAGNPLKEDVRSEDFYIDKTEPVVSIKKIVDKSANNDKGNIGYVITATDTNFDVFTPVLTAVVRNGSSFEKKVINAGSMSNISNGKAYTVTNLDSDGIYKITCKVVDKAGNAYSKVMLSRDREGKNTYEVNRSEGDTLLTFSVNREGSCFNIDKKTNVLLDKYYVQKVDNNIVIEEINADPLSEKQITLNGKILDSSKYTVTHLSSANEWEKYTYTIDKSLFKDEGEYNLVISSKDKAKNNAFSDVKDAAVKFVVDRTAPVVTVAGLSNDGRYQTENQTVTIIPTDAGGELKSIVVTLINQQGKTVKELLSLSDKDFADALEDGNGKLTFQIPEGLYQNIRIVCDDMADYGKDKNIIYDELFTNVSVTPSAFLIFWANKPLRYASIGGIIMIIAGIGVLVFFKKRKKKTANTTK
ncbi:MAG: hypothetical protein ACI4E1_02825 [Lachnospira sp.]